jgi:hypothetical protein
VHIVGGAWLKRSERVRSGETGAQQSTHGAQHARRTARTAHSTHDAQHARRTVHSTHGAQHARRTARTTHGAQHAQHARRTARTTHSTHDARCTARTAHSTHGAQHARRTVHSTHSTHDAQHARRTARRRGMCGTPRAPVTMSFIFRLRTPAPVFTSGSMSFTSMHRCAKMSLKYRSVCALATFAMLNMACVSSGVQHGGRQGARTRHHRRR